MFTRLLVASAASPRAIPVLAEARRLAALYGAHLAVLRVEKRGAAAEARLEADLSQAGFARPPDQVLWAAGDPARAILRGASSWEADLLVAGALEKEGLLTYYVGSVARRIAREAKASVLLLTEPRTETHALHRIVVDTDFGLEAERALRVAADLARRLGEGRLYVVHDVLQPGLSLALASSTPEEVERSRAQILESREDLMRAFLAQVSLRDVECETAVLIGRPGFATAEMAREIHADILVFPARRGRLGLLDRLFPSEVEQVLRDIPCALLLVR